MCLEGEKGVPTGQQWCGIQWSCPPLRFLIPATFPHTFTFFLAWQPQLVLSWNTTGGFLWNTMAPLHLLVALPIKESLRQVWKCPKSNYSESVEFRSDKIFAWQVAFYTVALRYGFFAPGTRKKQIKAGNLTLCTGGVLFDLRPYIIYIICVKLCAGVGWADCRDLSCNGGPWVHIGQQSWGVKAGNICDPLL